MLQAAGLLNDPNAGEPITVLELAQRNELGTTDRYMPELRFVTERGHAIHSAAAGPLFASEPGSPAMAGKQGFDWHPGLVRPCAPHQKQATGRS
jgi:hypothetical protein